MERETLATYTLELRGPNTGPDGHKPDSWNLDSGLLKETEENMTDLLPDGYYVRITPWDEETPDD